MLYGKSSPCALEEMTAHVLLSCPITDFAFTFHLGLAGTFTIFVVSEFPGISVKALSFPVRIVVQLPPFGVSRAAVEMPTPFCA
jgi:hypothetical protein